jgi:hypothetical protein
MNSLRAVVRGLAGLFVEDGSLALEVVAVILVAGVFSIFFPDLPLVAGGILLFGCLGTLFVNVARAGRR